MPSILILEDDITFSLMLKTWLGRKGFEVSSVSSVSDARSRIEDVSFDLILSDLRLPDGDGIDLLKWIKENNFVIPLIMMTSYAEIQTAVQAIKLGASDYIAKPLNPEELLGKIKDVIKTETGSVASATELERPARSAKRPEPSGGTRSQYVEGQSQAARQLYEHVRLVAPTDMSVLITGSSGTGKEYVARRIHEQSNRKKAPFIAVDCGAIPKDLAASEFFGHVKGSFTGALTDKTGAFVAANGGTIFLDEIGNLSYEVQIQLLRALQERKIRPVGSTQEISVDIRLVSATNENLEQAIEKGTFREDLYHRINEFTLRMPDLKERKEDILLFANFFLDQANKELDKHLIGFDAKASQALLSYHWPGNLRQMKNIVKRATLLAQSSFITLLELGTELLETPASSNTSIALRNEETEKEHILEALRQTGNNKSKAAQLLNIDRKTLYNKLKLYNIDL